MALRDIFKRKKPEKKPEKKKIKPKEKLVEPQPIKKEAKKPVEARPQQRARKIAGKAYKALKIPHVTEKASYLAGKNQYVFKVWPRTNKVGIKKAVEDVFGVDVLSVRIINIPRKKRRLGRIEGFRKGYKKAIVKIKGGQKIEILPR